MIIVAGAKDECVGFLIVMLMLRGSVVSLSKDVVWLLQEQPG